MTGWTLVVWTILSVGSAPQDSSIFVERAQLQEGWHTVRPGDTFEGLAKQYLGDSGRWRELWKLNPGIGNADRISPGQRLRVLLEDRLPGDGAMVFKTSRRVEDQLLPLTWQEAQQNDLLKALDSLRTHDRASAELLFFDDTHLIVTEKSLIVIGADSRPAPVVERAQIEIVLGQADLAGNLPAAGQGEIEIIIGGATAQPTAGEDGRIETRARRADGGGAQLMVYHGESQLAAGGQQLKVAQGMGSAVPESGPPNPPEKLLPAPGELDPVAGARLPTPRPRFTWEAVVGARDYTVEVCHDPACGALVERVTGLPAPGWQPAGLPVADLFWRVTATSPSGLDGYPSPAAAFSVLSDVEDSVPPTVTFTFTGPHMAPRSGLHHPWIVGPGFGIEIDAEDRDSGIARTFPVIDGEPATQEALDGPWTAGPHTLSVVAVDQVGNRQQSDSVELIYDPDPPSFSWGLEGVGGGQSLASTAPDDGAAPGRRGLQFIGPWRVESDFTQVILRPRKGRAHLPGIDQRLDKVEGLWILAEDAVCGDIELLTFDITGEELVVEAVDCVGNRSRTRWPLADR